MGLFDKTNPNATRKSVLTAAAESMVVGAIVFTFAFKALYVQAWPVTLPLWLLLCAGIGAISEWQVLFPNTTKKTSKDCSSEPDDRI